MAYAHQFVKITFGGDLADGQEIWSCNFHVIHNVPTPDGGELISHVENLLPDIGDDLTAYFTRSATKVPSGVRLRWIKAALIDVDGKYVDESYEIPLNATGAANGGYLPQTAIVNSLVSTKYKDPGKYNRFYLPVTTPSSGGSYALTGAEQTAYLASLKLFIEDVYETLNVGEPSLPYAPGVVSGTAGGSQMPIALVRIGRIIDSQRRRRNALNEQYEEVELFVT